MSLASRVANLFSSGTSTPQQGRDEFGFVDDGVPEGKQTFSDFKLGTEGFRSDTMAQKEVEEEEGRPPYLHVRWSYASFYSKLICEVHDRRRNWWNDWRPFDAFFRYGQNPTTRRSAYSAKIHDHGIFLFHNFSPGGIQTRTLWWLDTSITGLFSGDYYLLRNI